MNAYFQIISLLLLISNRKMQNLCLVCFDILISYEKQFKNTLLIDYLTDESILIIIFNIKALVN